MNSTQTRPTEKLRTDRKINVLSSGSRARRDIDVAGTTRQAELAPVGRSFSYTSY